jgi:hypothetical protein
MHHISDVSIALHVIIHVVSVIVQVTATATVFFDHSFLELELVLQDHLAETLDEGAYTFTMACLKLACWHVKFNTHFLELKDHVL